MDKTGKIAVTIICVLLAYFTFQTGSQTQLKSTDSDPKVENTSSQTQNTLSTEEALEKTAKTVDQVLKDSTTPAKTVTEELAVTSAEILTLKHDKSDKFVALIDPARGLLTVEMGDHRTDIDKDSPQLKLGSDKIASLGLTGDAKDWKYSAPVISGDKTSDGKAYTKLTVTRKVLGQDLNIIQTWELKEHENYHYLYTVNLENTGSKDINFTDLRLNIGQMKPISTAEGFAAQQASGVDQAIDAYLPKSEEIETNIFTSILSDIEETEENQKLMPGQGLYQIEKDEEEDGFKWIAVKNQYFVSIIDAQKQLFDKAYIGYTPVTTTTRDEDGLEKKHTSQIIKAEGSFAPFTIKSGASQQFDLDCYTGPQSYEELKTLGDKKDGVMQLNFFIKWKIGWLGLISSFILKALLLLNKYVGSFGIAIILLTVLIKLCFWRLTNKSNESMKKIQTLGPQMKELKEKFKDEPQRMQQETMKLYREHGVNPLGGCLPMLLQMPVFIALFNTLRGAIELRHSSFLWVSDLSQPDTICTIAGLPINPLVMVWAILMLLQQKVMPSTAQDPMQKKMMMFMPVMMLFFCYSMPSGLTLYWTFQSIMTITQYRMNNRKNTATLEATKA